MIVQAGIPFGFDYTAYDQDTGLFIAGNVWDITGVPAFVSQIPMTHVFNGTYTGLFTGEVGKVYLIETAVYTDGTYTVTDGTRSPGSDTYQVLDFTATFMVTAPAPTKIFGVVESSGISDGTVQESGDISIVTVTVQPQIIGTVQESGVSDGAVKESVMISGEVIKQGEIS